MRREAAAWLALALAAPARAQAAPMGIGVEPVAVVHLASDLDDDVASKGLTNALRQQVLDAPEYALWGESPSLVATAYDVRCKLGGAGALVPDDRTFDEACLRKMGKHIGVTRFLWGVVTARGGRPTVRLHFWQQGKGDRAVALPYEPDARERLAERLYRKLVTPEAVGDLAVAGAFEGELVVDGRAAGPFASGAELTLPAGEHRVEVRQGPRVVARARASVEAGRRVEARLEPVAAPAPVAPPRPVNEPPPVTIRPKASAWPWVLGGTAAAGLAGAGVFWGLREAELSDLGMACRGRACSPGQQSAVDRADRYGTLAAFSLGVGLAAGAGLAAYLGLGGRPPRVVGGAMPIAGGGALVVGGAF